MDQHASDVKTTELWARLFKMPSVRAFIGENADEIGLPEFTAYIRDICARTGEPPERVIRRADIERSFGHQIFRGSRRPSRDTVLQLAFGFQADVPMAQSLLKCSGHSPLYPRVERDVAIGYCLHHHMTLVDAQGVLEELCLPLIGSASNK
jgi:hypothetical protein